ncbi:6-phosphogluconolactonase [Kineosporia sp. NBRC 101731]|uniref:6-phosphogluconolactonase n=1 Tax=Kineosporia sp. NBRC 101731 TaxID=3032199 RepID=UPI0024A4CD5E|nr:6-phosphogluconolactonase [Kineosporia sp. NBRC 101731]GLY28729.1 6-phosphogluconolactonase [Kineosporia sp. NBRC 101731]
MSERFVFADGEQLATATAARLITAISDAQNARGVAHVVLTGGSNGGALLKAVASSPARDTVDWSRVDLWWGDERFLPAGDAERNEVQARGYLLDALPLEPQRVHVMAASDGEFGDDLDSAAAAYTAELATAAAASREQLSPSGSAVPGVPAFDVLMLGVGPDGHVASLFPGHPGYAVTEGTAIAVRESPKPPPERISLTLGAIGAARQVWLLAGGEGKAEAVSQALGGVDLPAGAVRGTERTLWLLDRAAASKL